jgi:hypothetical protein
VDAAAQRAAAAAAAVAAGREEEALLRSNADTISGAERDACSCCAACPGYEIWYTRADASNPEVMFFCSRCGCAAGAHAVCAAWARADEAARRRTEAAHRANAQARASAQAAYADSAMDARAARRAAHLALLGAPPNASRAVAAAAYRRQALRWHPDKQTGGDAARQAAAARFCAVADAWRQLCAMEE